MEPQEHIEHIHHNVRYAVRVMQRPPAMPGGPITEQKIISFARQDETEVWSFPLDEQSASELSRMLSPVKVASAGSITGLRPQGR